MSLDVTPMIAVRDVQRSVRWYRSLFGCTGDHGGDDFERLVLNGRTVLLLHRWCAPEHPSIRDAAPAGATGRGVILWFTVDELDAVWSRARDMGAEVLAAPSPNGDAGHTEFTLTDPDGYVVAVCAGG